MTSTTKAQQASKPAALKYRVAVRHIAQDQGWTFTQVATNVDQFTKGEVTIQVHHSPTHLITRAELADPKGQNDMAGSQGKMFTVQAWLTGVADPINPKTGKGKRFIRLTDDQVASFESGKGLGLIKTIQPKA